MDSVQERTSRSRAMEAGLLHLLRFARAQCHATVAFVALSGEEGIEVLAVPALDDGSEWTLPALELLARQTIEDPALGDGTAVIRVSEVLRRYWPGDRQFARMAVAPLKEPGAAVPSGLLCILDPLSGQFSDSNLEMLRHLSTRVVNHLRARRLMSDLREERAATAAPAGCAPLRPTGGGTDRDGRIVSRSGGVFEEEFATPALRAVPMHVFEDLPLACHMSAVGELDDCDEGRLLAATAPAEQERGRMPSEEGLGLSRLVEELDSALDRFTARGRPGALVVVEVRQPDTSAPAGRDELQRAAVRLAAASRADDVIVLVGEAMLAAILALRPGSHDLAMLRERLAAAVGREPARPELCVASAIVRIDPDEDSSSEDLLFSAVRELGSDRDDPTGGPSPDGGPLPGRGAGGGGSGRHQPAPCPGWGTVPGREGDPPDASAPPRVSSVATAEATEAAPGLARLAARGAAYLTAREAVGAVVRLAGTIVVMRFVGPAGYGVYAGAAAFVLFVTLSAQMGAEIYLIRQPEEPSSEVYGAVLAFLLASSCLLSVAGISITFVIPATLHPAGVLLPLRVLLVSVPLNVCWAPFQAKIERDFGYRKLGALELAGDAVLYAIAVPLAVIGLGAWSLVAGYFAWQAFLLGGAVVLSGMTPVLVWSPTTVRSLLRHGLSYASTSWVLALANLANPLVVGRYAGAGGVGFVSFAQRLVATIGFAARSAYRLGIVALSKITANERPRLRRAVEVGSTFQLVALAVPLGAFALLARIVVPAVFGPEWDRAISLYSLLALAAVLSASGLIQTSVLLSRGRNLQVTAAAAVQAVIFVAVLAVTVPRVGVVGYGLATVAALASLAVVDLMARREVSFGYRHLVPLAVGLVPPVFAALVPLRYGILTLLPLAGVLALPSTRNQLIGVARLGRSLVVRPVP